MGANKIVPSLDGLRTVAILLVFAEHADLPIHMNGSSGVTVFFFLSGYLITTLLRREQDTTGRVALGAFYLRRALRIFPPMYIALGVAIVLVLTGSIEDTITAPAQAAAALHVTNYWILIEGRDGLASTMFALWSLAVEEHFYLVFPLVLMTLVRWRLSRRAQATVLAAVCVALLCWRVWLSAHGASFDRLYLSTDTRADSILWGSVFALCANPVVERVRGPRWAWIYLALPVAVAVFWIGQRLPGQLSLTYGFTVQAAALAVVFTAVVAFPDSWAGRVLNWRPVAFLGVLSYCFYLFHRIPLIALEQHTELTLWPRAVVAFVLTVAASYLVYLAVERPIARLRRRLNTTGPAHRSNDGSTVTEAPVSSARRP